MVQNWRPKGHKNDLRGGEIFWSEDLGVVNYKIGGAGPTGFIDKV